MAKTRELRRRIRAIGSTRKITHAMELVAGAKMRRAAAAVLGTRRYAELAWELLAEVRRRADIIQHPLLEARAPVRRSAILVVSGNRGLVGAFHERIVARVLAVIRAEPSSPLVLTSGTIARDLLHRRGVSIEADFPKKDLLADPTDASPIAKFLLRAFQALEVDRVVMVYVDFHSVLRQETAVRVLLPVGEPNAALGTVAEQSVSLHPSPSPLSPRLDYLFEPSPEHVLEAIVPNLLTIQVYQALLETTASEHAARMVTMRSATENADEIHDEFVLAFNDARKASITQEILEIVGGQRGVTRE